MNYKKILALTPALLLAACGGSEQSMEESVTPGAVVYSYPAGRPIKCLHQSKHRSALLRPDY